MSDGNVLRNNIRNTDEEEATEEISKETIGLYIETFRKLMEDYFKQRMAAENIERYKDMKIYHINTIYASDGTTVDHYTYDVKDTDTGDIYEGLISKTSDTLANGDFVRVYLSNIEYIGFKI